MGVYNKRVIYKTLVPMVVLSRTCREVFVVNDFYACFHMVATVVTLSQVNFVPRSYKHPAAVVKRQTQFPQRGPSPVVIPPTLGTEVISMQTLASEVISMQNM